MQKKIKKEFSGMPKESEEIYTKIDTPDSCPIGDKRPMNKKREQKISNEPFN